MFTGIIQAQGSVIALKTRGGDAELRVETTAPFLAAQKLGDSVAVNGVCLTLTRIEDKQFSADLSRETLLRTTLGGLVKGNPVNLEPALRAGDPLGGHLVSGHVDGLAKLLTRHEDARSLRMSFAAPEELHRYIAAKGSVCLDGVSLTVNEVEGLSFDVNLIPHTASVTTLGRLEPGAQVNLEVDTIARYLERLMNRQT